MTTPLDDQRDLIGNLRSDGGVLLTIIESIVESRQQYDRLGLADDSVLQDAALIPLGTTRADLRSAILAIDALLMLLAQGHADRLERFARGVE